MKMVACPARLREYIIQLTRDEVCKSIEALSLKETKKKRKGNNQKRTK